VAKVHIERGRIIETIPEIVLCLWENWDIFDAVLGGKWKLQKIREGVFTGASRGVSAKIEHMSTQTQHSSGVVRYLATGFKFGAELQAIVTLKYAPTRDNKTSVEGIIDIEARGLKGLALKAFSPRINELADEVIADGDKACTFIMKRLDEAGAYLSQDQMETLRRYLGKTRAKGPIKSLEHKPIVEEGMLRLGIRDMGLRENYLNYFFEVEVGSSSFGTDYLVDPEEKNRILNTVQEITTLANTVRVLRSKPHIGKSSPLAQDELGQRFKYLGEHLFHYFIPEALKPHLRKLRPFSNLVLETTDQTIPWELLFFDADFMCLKHSIGRRPIFRGIPVIFDQELEIKRRQKKIKALVLANPTENLQDAEREGDEVVRRLRRLKTDMEIDYYKRREVKKQMVVKCLEDGIYDIIHFAGHGDFNENPRLSRLFLSDSDLIADEILRIMKGSPIVFANACSTARMTDENGRCQVTFVENIQGLASSFLAKGSTGYIGAMWPVHDDYAAHLSSEFYRGLVERKESIGESLRKARLSVRKKAKENDFTWASFILYGDPRRELLS